MSGYERFVLLCDKKMENGDITNVSVMSASFGIRQLATHLASADTGCVSFKTKQSSVD